MDIFCVSQPALAGCDDDAQISGEHEEEGEQNVSLSLQLFSVILEESWMARKTTAVGSFSAAGGSFLSLLRDPTSSY